MPPGRRLRRILVLLLKVSLGFLAVSVLAVIVLRFMAPPFSALMVERRIGSWFGEGKYSPTYQWVSLDKIAPVMSAAVIASEDQSFPYHYGFDLAAIQRAMGHNERSSRTKGASTLTQQTAKNMFLWSSRSWLRKGVEAYFTVLLETFWGKRRILETYLNIVEFGDGIYGVEAASQRYFRKPASRLNSEEAAILAAVLPNPRRYKVSAPGPYVRERQQWILQQMDQLGGSSFVKKFE
jgi:monofunctional biosynthetic peptidoglycan transglycosylase